MSTKVEFDIPYGAEQWRPLNYNGKILTRYMVSDHGRIYDNQTNEFLSYYHMRGEYWHARIRVNHSTSVNCSVHRAVLMSFNPIPNFDEMQVDHIDGNPCNNRLNNLEWVTPMENTRRAINTGLRNQTGTSNGRAVYDDDTIRRVCELIDQGLGNAQIATALGYLHEPERGSFAANVSSIRHGKTRRDISCNYNFMGGNQFKFYGEDFAYLACCFLSDPNRDFTYDEIADFLDIPKNERLNFKQYVNKLINGRTSVKITEQYNLKRPKDYYEDCSFGYANRQYA